MHDYYFLSSINDLFTKKFGRIKQQNFDSNLLHWLLHSEQTSDWIMDFLFVGLFFIKTYIPQTLVFGTLEYHEFQKLIDLTFIDLIVYSGFFMLRIHAHTPL